MTQPPDDPALDARPQLDPWEPSIKQLVMQTIHSLEESYQSLGAIRGLPTGFTDLDRMTDGLHAAEMIVIAARPSMGKTAFAMNIAEHLALEQGKPIAIFSPGMSRHELVLRLLCSRARVDFGCARLGMLSERDFPALQTAASHFAASQIFIDDTIDLSILDMRARARRLKHQHDIQAVFVDDFHHLSSPTPRAQHDRQQEIAEISSGLKRLARELNIPVLVLARLNRNSDQRTGENLGRPFLGDLCESGSIEEDADLVGLLVREEYYAASEEEREAARGKATLVVARHRHGPVGDVPLTFLPEFVRFESRVEEEI